MYSQGKRLGAVLLSSLLFLALCSCAREESGPPSAGITPSSAAEATDSPSYPVVPPSQTPPAGEPTNVADDYEYEENGDGTVTITRYTGPGGDIEIPAELDGKPVTAIGNTFKEEGAFQGCTTLTSVVIPEGVTELQDNAFYECSNLVSVTIPASVTLLRNCAFSGCTNLQSVSFAGNAPKTGNYVFDAQDVIFYCHEGAEGWTNPWYGAPTELYS